MSLEDFFLFIPILLFLIAFYYLLAAYVPTRLNPHQAPKSRFEFVPVGANDSPTRADGVDIIFIHGLASNPDTTWRVKLAQRANTPKEAVEESRQFVNWVSDFLPEDLPPAVRSDVRMFYYNYDSYWKRDAVLTRLATLGNELLERINGEIRASEAERSRSLIFVAHCYGGLVVKQALVQARASRDFGYVAEYTKAILFLGTPHRGSDLGIWGWLAACFLQPLLGSNPQLLANLKYDSTSLLDLHEAFAGEFDLRVFNFFEQRPIFQLPFIGWEQYCVREHSATYAGPKVRNIGLPVDHYKLNKFRSRSESYKVILAKLTEATQLFARSTINRYYAVPVEAPHTYTERAGLSEELAQKLRIQHENTSVKHAVTLHGLGGAGKSQLALNYAEKHRDQYNPILWIDATDEEAARSSFRRCGTELGLSEEHVDKQESVLTDPRVQAVLRWLRNRTEADDEWLVIVDNADDLRWGLQKIMPKGKRGSVLVTSRDEQSVMLMPKACEKIRVGPMSPEEGTTLLLHHLRLDAETASETTRSRCDDVAQKLGYLALAIELAGAYIGNDPTPEQALSQYLADYDGHRDELLKMDRFRGLLPTERTVWTVWDTTLQRIRDEHADLQLDILLTFLAYFKGTIVQDEVFRLASLGMKAAGTRLENEADRGTLPDIRQYIPVGKNGWDSFRYRQCYDVLVRYALLQRVEGAWPGVTMHSLVQWRARQGTQTRPWEWSYMMFIAAACSQMCAERGQPEFRRHLIVHIPEIDEDYSDGGKNLKKIDGYVERTIAEVYLDEALWKESEKLGLQGLEVSKRNLGAEHPETLASMNNLADTYHSQGRWEEAELLNIQVMETSKAVLGPKHPDTLISMHNLAYTWKSQSRNADAVRLMEDCVRIRRQILGPEHPKTLASVSKLNKWQKESEVP
ncbi:hypothetical protein F4802DRAFT_29064 [Xylaria palmicola]|nr:hypothetical protein F4802DRAFT_29064 [Xylaria palmicola]